jgi:hypothetical protein
MGCIRFVDTVSNQQVARGRSLLDVLVSHRWLNKLVTTVIPNNHFAHPS